MVETNRDLPATHRQRWMLYILTKDKQWWDIKLTMSEASREIAAAKTQVEACKRDKVANFQALFKTAQDAGLEAMLKTIPTPIVVEQHKNQLDDNSPVEQSWFVSDGVCGFAWITVRPGNSSFARWLVKMKYGKVDGYSGGVTIWIREGRQSMQLKEAYARAMTEVLRQADIRAYAHSRID